MLKVIQWWLKPARISSWDSYNELEEKWGQMIETILNETLKQAESFLERPIDWPEFMFRTSELEIEMEEILQDINLPPCEEEYIESTWFKIALLEQRFREWRFNERLLKVLKN